jgi:hypothetical protein
MSKPSNAMRHLLPTLLLCSLVSLLPSCGEPPKPTVNLYRAVHTGDVDQIKRHLFWGTDVNQPGADGNYPLHVAVSQGKVAIAKELLRHGASTNSPNALGQTPLHVALANGKVPAAELLLSRGADDDLQALFFQLVDSGDVDRDTLDLLIREGVDIDKPADDGIPALHTAVISGNVKLAKRLISAGADVNAAAANGATPMSLAASIDDPTTAGIMTELLRQYGATPAPAHDAAASPGAPPGTP